MISLNYQALDYGELISIIRECQKELESRATITVATVLWVDRPLKSLLIEEEENMVEAKRILNNLVLTV